MQASSTDESDDDEESDEEYLSLIAKDKTNSEHEDLFAIIANSDFDVDDEEEPVVIFHDIKDKIHTYTKNKMISLSGILIDAYQKIMLKRIH